MATHHTADDKSMSLLSYATNHASWGKNATDLEARFFITTRGLAAIPWGVDRDTALKAAGTAYGHSLTATSPWLREQEFWSAVTITPAP